MAAAVTSSSPPVVSQRDPFLDNAKFWAIVLVVCGHLVEDLRDVPYAHALYLFVYTFHMPLFITISGYLSRNFTRLRAQKLVSTLLVPYVIFEIAYSLPRWILYGKFQLTLLDPYFLTWFLLSLFIWRLSTPVWFQVKWPLAVAVGISLISGASALPDELSMNRTLGLLPFYVLGLVLTPRHFDLLKRRWVRLTGALVLAVGIGITFLVHYDVPTEWIRWRHAYTRIGVDNVTGAGIRLLMLVIGAVLVAAFLSIITSKKTWFTALGGLTIYAYLLHGFVVKGLDRFHDQLDNPVGVAAVIVFGVALTAVLCTPPFRRLFKWAIEPNLKWAFKSDPGRQPPPGPPPGDHPHAATPQPWPNDDMPRPAAPAWPNGGEPQTTRPHDGTSQPWPNDAAPQTGRPQGGTSQAWPNESGSQYDGRPSGHPTHLRPHDPTSPTWPDDRPPAQPRP
ncbi:acyltransferase family protein [Herbidospora cretacea]|uniref:acyltransferase family protein n=1 Tax=Herbidospora cretacea TaxID=28444 RepID=UPI0009DDBF21|nr:acyltransferase family protein [Herbidospora cretacea]